MLKEIRSWTALVFLVVTLVALLGFTVWMFWITAPAVAVWVAAWLALLVGAWIVEQVAMRRAKADDVLLKTQYDRRRTDEMARELRRLKPESRTASLILDHKPAYERRRELQ